jgi:hypothetical protein
MLYFYTENFFWSSRAKNFIKKILDKKARGPQAVERSLFAGLKQLGVEFRVNTRTNQKIETACVLSGIETLKWVIRQKQKGEIKKIIAGPNLVVVPDEAGGIIKSPEIDTVVVPSRWVKDFYVSIDPELSSKIYIWAAGVELPKKEQVEKEYDFLVLNKTQSNMDLCDSITAYLKEQKFKIHVMFYGDFKQEQYFNALKYTKYLIYLSESESQGLSMFEAWARDVPSLVWDRGFMQYEKYQWQGNTASPYLSGEVGMSFKNFEYFKLILSNFLNRKFLPLNWVKNNATNEIAAKKYLEIIDA